VRQDHFALILNEPAGKIAQIVVENTVKLLIPVRGSPHVLAYDFLLVGRHGVIIVIPTK
jgi:Heterokaryon incompatibility protein Het-C